MKNYLLFGFPLKENERLREKIIPLYKQHPINLPHDERTIIVSFVHEDPENLEAFFGIILGSWEDRKDNIDVRYDTQRYLERQTVQMVKDILDVDISLNKFRVLGFSKNK